jgi:excisionase family DNA binding protein
MRNERSDQAAADSETLALATERTRPGVIGVDELAEYLAVPSSWIYDNHHRLGLPAIKLGRHLRFRASDVDAWLETRKRCGR